jgi:hypothetical protein
MPTKRNILLLKLIFIISLVFTLISCGKSESPSPSSPEDVTNQIDETDHSSDIPNDPVFKTKE